MLTSGRESRLKIFPIEAIGKYRARLMLNIMSTLQHKLTCCHGSERLHYWKRVV